jgi:predicted DNA-binding transcriptional regulator AlpA
MSDAIKCQSSASNVSLEPLLIIDDLERLLRVHRRTISRLCKDGKIPRPFKLGGTNRWRARDIANVLDQSMVSPGSDEC